MSGLSALFNSSSIFLHNPLLLLFLNAPIHLEMVVIIVSVFQHLGRGNRNFSDPSRISFGDVWIFWCDCPSYISLEHPCDLRRGRLDIRLFTYTRAMELPRYGGCVPTPDPSRLKVCSESCFCHSSNSFTSKMFTGECSLKNKGKVIDLLVTIHSIL